MKPSFVFFVFLMIFVLVSCIQASDSKGNYNLNIFIQDILSASEFDALSGVTSDYAGATYVNIKVNNTANDTLFIWGHEPEEKRLLGSYLPASIEYSYYDSLESERQHHVGSGDDWSGKPIPLLPGSSHDFFFFNMADFRTDSIIYRFRYSRDTFFDAAPCYILTTYLFKNQEVVANVGYEDTCAPEPDPVQENQ